MEKFDYNVEKQIATISTKGKIEKRLTLTSWKGAKAKYDLRIWREDANGETIPGKGITFDEEELLTLKKVLEGLEIE